MRLLGSGLLAVAAMGATPVFAQEPGQPALGAVRGGPVDGRLAPRLKDTGAQEGWASLDEPPVIRLKAPDGRSEWDLSATTRFVEETRANAVDFQTQGLFEAEGAIVRRVGDFRIGAVGYSARTVGDRDRRGPRLGSMKWQGNAIGPVVGYDTELAGKTTTFSVRWYREIGAPGEDGDTLSASMTVRF